MTVAAPPKIYTVNGPSSTSSSTLPSWLTVKARPTNHRKRVRTQRQLGQLELIQDFAFPESAIRIKTTSDGYHAIGTGSYKPMMKVWDLDQLTVKFERVTDAENVDFVVSGSVSFCMTARDYSWGRFSQQTGQRRYIYNVIVLSHFTLNLDCTILFVYLPMVVHWDIIRRLPMLSSLAPGPRFTDSTSKKDGTCHLLQLALASKT